MARDLAIFVGLFAAALAMNFVLWLVAIWLLQALGLWEIAPTLELELGTHGPTGQRSGV